MNTINIDIHPEDEKLISILLTEMKKEGKRPNNNLRARYLESRLAMDVANWHAATLDKDDNTCEYWPMLLEKLRNRLNSGVRFSSIQREQANNMIALAQALVSGAMSSMLDKA